VGRVPPPLLESPLIRRGNLKGKSEGPSPYVKGLQPFLSPITLSFKLNYTAELLQRFRSRQVDVELYGQGCKTLRRNRPGRVPSGAVGGRQPPGTISRPVPLNPGVRGEYTKGAVRWYPPLHYRAAVCWRTEEGEVGHAVVVEAAVGTFASGVGPDRARVLTVWGRVVAPRLRRRLVQEAQGCPRVCVTQNPHTLTHSRPR
jgi:hypothetical protein